MNEETFKERATRLREINKVVEGLDPAIRLDAFKLLQSYAGATVGSATPEGGAAPPMAGLTVGQSDEERDKFFTAHTQEKASDSALSIAAYLYSQFGTEAFSMEEVHKLATAVGLTIPNRTDSTFLKATRDSKKLFAPAGKGKYMPTVHGETYFKTTFSVSKGKLTRPAEGK